MKTNSLLIRRTLCIPVMIMMIAVSSCTKNFLDKKPDQSLLVPTTLKDFRALLDANSDMNVAPYLNMVATDDIYTTEEGLLSADYLIRNSYTWEKDIYQSQTDYNWNIPYQQVFYANVVLDGLENFTPEAGEQAEFNEIKGAALFYRSFAFYNLAQQFAAAYVPATAEQVPGIPVRLSSDVNIKSGRGTLKGTYGQMVNDFTEAEALLPEQANFATRPTRAAAAAMLARVYQTMQDFGHAREAADAAIRSPASLMDYNDFSETVLRPFPKLFPVNGNTEVLFYSPLISNASFLISPSLTFIDSVLYRSYDEKDLRRTLFFKPGTEGMLFRGNYTNGVNVFAGIALDEVYLIRAEAYARLGNTAAAMADLNTLLRKRWRKAAYTDMSAADPDAALSIILEERRKELVYRNLIRWTDLKRLNQEPRFAVTVRRVINGKTYILQPGDPKYAFPIPDDEISRSGIEQNPR